MQGLILSHIKTINFDNNLIPLDLLFFCLVSQECITEHATGTVERENKRKVNSTQIRVA